MRMRIGSIAALLCIAGSAMALEFGNAQLKMHFADAPAKGGLLGITDVKRGIEVLKANNADPLLWELRLSEVGSDQMILTLTNRSADHQGRFVRLEGHRRAAGGPDLLRRKNDPSHPLTGKSVDTTVMLKLAELNGPYVRLEILGWKERTILASNPFWLKDK